eukprot:gene60973-83390_t
MREAVIVSTARTPLTKAHRGEFNITPGPTLAAFAVKAAVERSGLFLRRPFKPADISDMISFFIQADPAKTTQARSIGDMSD